MTVIDLLENEGFVRHQNDEPFEDYWLLEHGPDPDLLVEMEGQGWRICRMPQDDEPQGVWVDIAFELDEKACIAEVQRLLGTGHVTDPAA